MANPWVQMQEPDDDETQQPQFAPTAPGSDFGLGAVAQPFDSAARVPASSKDNLLSVRDQLQKYLAEQGKGQDYLKQLAEQYGNQLDAQGGQINLSPLMSMLDDFYGGTRAKNYQAPPSASDITQAKIKAQEGIEKAGDPMAQELLKEYSTDNSAQSQYYRTMAGIAKQTANNLPTPAIDSATGSPIVLSKPQQALAKELHDNIFLVGRSNPAVRASQDKLRTATNFENLAAALPKGEATPQDMADLTSALGQTINGTNLLTDERFKSLYPQNMALTSDNVVQWLFSEPKGVQQTKWINRWLNEVEAEKAGAQKVFDHWIDAHSDSVIGRGLPRDFVNYQKDVAKRFYNSAYQPVAGLGGFSPTGPGGATSPPVPGAVQKMRNGKPVWAIPLGNGKFKEVK